MELSTGIFPRCGYWAQGGNERDVMVVLALWQRVGGAEEETKEKKTDDVLTAGWDEMVTSKSVSL